MVVFLQFVAPLPRLGLGVGLTNPVLAIASYFTVYGDNENFRCLSRISKVKQFLRALPTGRINYLTFKQILYLA